MSVHGAGKNNNAAGAAAAAAAAAAKAATGVAGQPAAGNQVATEQKQAWVATGAAARPAVVTPGLLPPDAPPPFALGKNGGLSPPQSFTRFLGMEDPTEATLESMDSTLRDYFKTGQFGEFTGEGGKTIRYGVFGPPPGVPVKGVVNISTGTRETMVKYTELLFNLRQLRAEGYVVALADHRGQGFSDKEIEGKLHIGDHTNFVKDQSKFRKEVLEKHFGNKVPYSLVGHSLGGAIAARTVQQNPNDYQRLVLMSPMLDIETGMKKPIEEAASAGLAKVAANSYSLGQGPYTPNPAFEGNKTAHSKARFDFINRQFQRNPASHVDGVTNQWVHQGMQLDKAILQDAQKLKAIGGGKGEVHVLLPTDDKLVQGKASWDLAKQLGVKPTEFNSKHELLAAGDPDRKQVLNVLKKTLFR